MTETQGRRPKLLLTQMYDRLLAEYGPQGWWPAETDFEMLVGAILTQNTSWTNVERALANMREAGSLNPAALRDTDLERLAAIIRPSGYFNAKARKLQALGEYLARYDDDLIRLFRSKPLPELRKELLAVFGIGPETADSMLLYAGGR